MEFSNQGQSFYHRFEGSFLHNETGELIHCTGPRRQWVQDNWNLILSSPQTLQDSDVRIYQSAHGTKRNKSAVVINGRLTRPEDTAFEEFFVQLILDQADLCANGRCLQAAENESTTQQIVDMFDSYLRYQAKDDRWARSGRVYFAERVRHFTRQNAPVEFCLPAFPCKSSNRDKVSGPNPDRGEELALDRLHGFVEAIEQRYRPGAKLWIISDGHVFSDCIGVDDAEVDAYGNKLKDMNHAIGLRRGNTDRVGFKSLVDLFQLAAVGSDESLRDLARRFNIPDIDHQINTKVTEEAKLCRQILMAGCGPHKSAVRAKIDSSDAAITALYRGFSRFMLEDLEHHPHTQKMTRSQQKKLSSRVAFEMILRNQAYSNLVEMLFPNHVRLSIHAHNNAGPKFGIQLFDPVQVRAVEGLSPNGELMISHDLLHIPTPWHNSVVQLAESDIVLVTKAKVARAALVAGSMTGGLIETEEGSAYFSLQRRDASINTDGPEMAGTEAAERETDSEIEAEKDGAVTVTVTVTVKAEGKDVSVADGRLQKQATFSEKADAVVTAVVRRNTGGLSAGDPSWPAKAANHNSWIGRLRWILSLFWPRSL